MWMILGEGHSVGAMHTGQLLTLQWLPGAHSCCVGAHQVPSGCCDVWITASAHGWSWCTPQHSYLTQLELSWTPCGSAFEGMWMLPGEGMALHSVSAMRSSAAMHTVLATC